MAVYKRNYKAWAGAVTPLWSRFLILTRYAWMDVRRSRFLTMFLVASCFFPIGCAAFIYVKYHLQTIAAQFGLEAPRLENIESMFFMVFLNVQATFCWFLTAMIGPQLIAPDLSNNALPLYFCRPITRAEYVLGKASVLLMLLSAITWVPGLVLFGMEASLAGGAWLDKYWWLARAIFLASVLLIVVLTATALAISAWVKWRIAASAAILGFVFISAGVAGMFNEVLRTKAGHWIDIGWLVTRVWMDLFRRSSGPAVAGSGALSVGDAWSALGAFCAVSLLILSRKIRAYEVVS